MRLSILVLMFGAAACSSSQPSSRDVQDAQRPDVPRDAPRDAPDAMQPDRKRVWTFDYGPAADLNLLACKDQSIAPPAPDLAVAIAVEPAIEKAVAIDWMTNGGPAPAMDAEGNLYYQSSASVISLTAQGTQRWKFSATTEQYVDTAILIRGDLALFGQRSVGVVALDRKSGAVKWKTALDGPFLVASALTAGGLASGAGLIFVGGGDSTLYGLTEEGSISVRTPVAGLPSYGPPVVDETGTLYLTPQPSRRLYSVSSTGVINWVRLFTDATLGVDSPLPAGGRVGVIMGIPGPGPGGRKEAMVSQDCGVTRWNQAGAACSLVRPDGNLICIRPGNGATVWQVVSLSAADGAELWTADLDGTEDSGAFTIDSIGPIGRDGVVYVTLRNIYSSSKPGSASQLKAFAIGTGKPLWTLSFMDSYLRGQPVLAEDGRMYLFGVHLEASGAVQTYMFVVRTTSPGLAKQGWPRSTHDNQNTNSALTPL